MQSAACPSLAPGVLHKSDNWCPSSPSADLVSHLSCKVILGCRHLGKTTFNLDEGAARFLWSGIHRRAEQRRGCRQVVFTAESRKKWGAMTCHGVVSLPYTLSHNRNACHGVALTPDDCFHHKTNALHRETDLLFTK